MLPRHRASLLLFVLALGSSLAPTLVASEPKRAPEVRDGKKSGSDESDSNNKSKRHREGSPVAEVTGTFRLINERYWFRQIDGDREFRVLENLALERVTRVLGQHHENRIWTVSGTVTEFQGENFLLITRAVLKSKAEATDSNPGSER